MPRRPALTRVVRLAGCATLILVLAGCDALGKIGVASHSPAAKSFTVSSRVTAVDIEGGSGSISVTGSARSGVAVTQHESYSKTPPSATHVVRGTTLTLTYKCPVEVLCGVAYNVRVPAGVSVTVTTGAGAITLTSLTGTVTARADAGLITAVSLGSATATFTSNAGGVVAAFSAVPRSVSASTNVGPITLTVPGTVAYRVAVHTFVGTSTISVRKSDTSAHQIHATSDLGSISINPA